MQLFGTHLGFLTGRNAKLDFLPENLDARLSDNRLEKDERLGEFSRGVRGKMTLFSRPPTPAHPLVSGDHRPSAHGSQRLSERILADL